MGTLFNTNLLFDRDGTLLNRHRKLVPTWAEKLTWANGDASYLPPEETDIGRVGTLICGENTNTLARFTLLAQGEQVHIATYPPAWPFHRPGGGAHNYNLTEAIRLRSAAHAFEGKVFNVVASCALDADAIEQLSQGDSKMKELLQAVPAPVSIIVGPSGELLADPVEGGESMVVAEIDIACSIEPKMIHDIVGHYNRFDIFHLEVDPTPNRPVWIKKPTRRNEQPSDEPPQVSPGEATNSANERSMPAVVLRAKA
jgi:nitrilase/aliphatic nitrilase